MKSTLKEKLEFGEGDHKVIILPEGLNYNFASIDYTATVYDEKGRGELSFGEQGAIVECRHFEKDGKFGSMSVNTFRERFKKTLSELVPSDFYKKYLIALDMGPEGIFRRGRMFGTTDWIRDYL